MVSWSSILLVFVLPVALTVIYVVRAERDMARDARDRQHRVDVALAPFGKKTIKGIVLRVEDR